MHVLSRPTHTHKLRTVIISAKFKTFLTFLFYNIFRMPMPGGYRDATFEHF